VSAGVQVKANGISIEVEDTGPGIEQSAQLGCCRKLMPRIGVSYPITTRASVFFAYGHFTQMPPLGDIFSNADYSVLKNVAAGGVTFHVVQHGAAQSRDVIGRHGHLLLQPF
jgi:hypothetical protein